ncbi:MAG: DUF1553 domain-containing protein, partial [Planctomycetales bacterium]|nr:DUF1553 domain-containing protein [Planctomycetales bacterium]
RVPQSELVERRSRLEAEIARLEESLPEQFPPDDGPGDEPTRRRRNFAARFAQWASGQREAAVDWQVLQPTEMKTNLPRLKSLDDGSILSTGDITKRDLFTLRFSLAEFDKPVTALRLEAMPDERLPAGGPGRCYYEGRQGDFFLSEVTARHGDTPLELIAPSVSYGKISIGGGSATGENVLDGDGSTGWSTSQREGEPHQLVLNLSEPLPSGGELELTMLFERHFAASLGRFRWSAACGTAKAVAKEMPAAIEAILARDPAAWDDASRAAARRYFAQVAPQLADARKPIAALRRQIPELPVTLVMQERDPDNPRPTFRHHRGEYTQPKEPVTPGLPALFAATTDHAPGNRLELARWLVSRDNPLAARVAVNRAWRSFFGYGLV